MSDPAAILDPIVRGIAAGAMAATALVVWRSRVSFQARWVTLAMGVSTVCWLITESWSLWGALGNAVIVVAAAYPVGGLFWLFIGTVFEDRPITAPMLAPPAGLLALGLAMGAAPSLPGNLLWWLFNGVSGLLALHAGFIVIRGRREDLVEGRRRLRALLLGLVAVFVVAQVGLAFLNRLNAAGSWRLFLISGPYGGAILATLILAGSVLFLQARPDLFGGARRAEPASDPRAEAADRLMLGKLDAFVAAEGWRREGLSIGALAGEL